jgi:rhodanese-related sulfurtransferase
MSRINELPKDKPVVLYCNSGKRSRSLKYMIEKLHSFNNLTHLEGGFQKWQEEVATL